MLSEGNNNDPSMLVFHFNDILEATDNFSFENKLGEGGYGPVYKVKICVLDSFTVAFMPKLQNKDVCFIGETKEWTRNCSKKTF